MSELAPFEDARTAVIAACARLEAEYLSLGDSAGRTIAETVIAREDLIPFERSAMDGYAIRAIDGVPGARLTIAARAYAGTTTRVDHAPHTATAVATGAPLPHGADAVVPFERVGRNDDAIVIRDRVAAGDHVFPAGDDARIGDVLVRDGEPLSPGTLALLAASGIARVRCARRPRVAVLTTGEELVDVLQTPRFGEIRNSNATMVAASVTEVGAVIAHSEHVRDDRTALRDALANAIATCDLVITTGGASVGERDFVKRVLDELGAAFAFRSVALRPARPTSFSTLGTARILSLPGNPAAAFVGLQAFGIPALRALTGARDVLPRRIRARLRGSLHGKNARTYLAFVHLTVDEAGVLEAHPLDNQCSSLTRTAAGAAGFAVIGPEIGDVGAGDLVPIDVFAWEAIKAAAPLRENWRP